MPVIVDVLFVLGVSVYHVHSRKPAGYKVASNY